MQNALEHSAILLTFNKLPFVFKTFVLSIFEWPLKTGFTVYCGHYSFLGITSKDHNKTMSDVFDSDLYVEGQGHRAWSNEKSVS